VKNVCVDIPAKVKLMEFIAELKSASDYQIPEQYLSLSQETKFHNLLCQNAGDKNRNTTY
jgi:hypothetical protein